MFFYLCTFSHLLQCYRLQRAIMMSSDISCFDTFVIVLSILTDLNSYLAQTGIVKTISTKFFYIETYCCLLFTFVLFVFRVNWSFRAWSTILMLGGLSVQLDLTHWYYPLKAHPIYERGILMSTCFVVMFMGNMSGDKGTVNIEHVLFVWR